MRRHTRSRLTFVLAAAAPLLAPAIAGAAIQYFTSQTSFSAAAPGLAQDNFGGNGVYTQPYNAPGVAIDTLAGGSQNLILNGHGIAPNYFGDDLLLNFAPTVTAVGMNVDGATLAGSVSPGGSLVANIYLQGSANPVQTSYPLSTNTPFFLGAVSTTPITKIDLLFDYNSDAYTDLSSLQIGNVPEPSSAIALGAMAALAIQRRQRAN
jgi:hypothetical protein